MTFFGMPREIFKLQKVKPKAIRQMNVCSKHARIYGGRGLLKGGKPPRAKNKKKNVFYSTFLGFTQQINLF